MYDELFLKLFCKETIFFPMGKMVRGFKSHKNAKAAMLFAIAAFYRLYFMFLKKDCADYC